MLILEAHPFPRAYFFILRDNLRRVVQWVCVWIRGSQVQTPLQSAGRCVPGQDTSPQITPVGIAHSIEYVSRFG